MNKPLQSGEASVFNSAEQAPVDPSSADAQDLDRPELQSHAQLAQYQSAKIAKAQITKMNKSWLKS